jgi:hypothetical protein
MVLVRTVRMMMMVMMRMVMLRMEMVRVVMVMMLMVRNGEHGEDGDVTMTVRT